MNGCNHPNPKPTSLLLRVLCILSIGFLAACQPAPAPQPTAPAPTPTPAIPSAPQAEVSFTARLLSPLPSGASLSLSILDEVTGLAVNPATFPMTQGEAGVYSVSVPVRLNSLLKYRYTTGGNQPVIETNSRGQAVRYRAIHVDGPATIDDLVWSLGEPPSDTPTGRIAGIVTSQQDGLPVPDLLVCAAGLQTLTAGDGSFVLENVPEGTQRLVISALDGEYQTFQQGARVVAGLTTPADLQVAPTATVEVTFHVTVPKENVIGLPVRLAGNLYSLGNTFSDLSGGLSTRGAQMPLLARQEDGSYKLTLHLHPGTDLQYKYTLGDGFWNAELNSDGQRILRQFIVPDRDLIVEDSIASWRAPNQPPVTIQVTTPSNTPAGELVSIQFNPSVWTEPLPMWPLGDHRWVYILYNPLKGAGPIQYRYCRNTHCDLAGQVSGGGVAGVSASFTASETPQVIEDTIQSWEEWEPSGEPTTVVGGEPQARSSGFSAGVELQPGIDPRWLPVLPMVYKTLFETGSNTLLITPSWTLDESSTPQLEPIPGQDTLVKELVATIGQAEAQGLRVVLFPGLRSAGRSIWTATTAHDAGWWDTWFARYRTFLLQYADLAAQTSAAGLVIGGEGISSALPGGKLPGGAPSGVPDDAATHWENLIQEVRARYGGSLLWAQPFTQASDLDNPPAFISSFDQVYLLWSASLSSADQSEAGLEAAFNAFFDGPVTAYRDAVQKPVWVGLAYASVDDAAVGCPLGLASSPCSASSVQSSDGSPGSPNLQAQLDIYNAAFSALNAHPWVEGIISRGYFPAVPLQDTTASVHGKPAADVLWFWFGKMIAAAQ